MSTYVIAEAGVNHNGSMDLARDLIEVAAEAGVDAIKFQTFQTEEVVTNDASKADYQSETTDARESQADMLRNLELGLDQHEAITEYCEECDVQFLSTPADVDSAQFLVDSFGVPRIKIGSGELTNGPFLLEVARLGKPVILSTGMGTLGEVEQALGVLAYGYVKKESRPEKMDLERAFASDEGQSALESNVTLLHCITEYPAPVEAANLRAMGTLEQAFGLPVGLSDHTMGTTVPTAAVARGATLIEKHFTLDRSLSGPDHEASLEPEELAEMVENIRCVESALGDPRKVPREPEWENRSAVRRSLVASKPIEKGDRFTTNNLAAKRPGGGISPMEYWKTIGKTSSKSYKKGELINE
ncbi:N-acetylneuraminate synthase [Salinibacter ruber]|uniref:N-acetylneuraminate synthase n=1 Tax=Salinibacter ruber TaxID=146919 RepID=UPI002073D44B|nr:N-acetylneuraminate synthase [Salinibacter ruber]